MSEEIFTVQTPFPDVVALAQGYMNRADGERLLLPLPVAFSQGAGIRFVVYLADGTPAFAGAGLCVQASDQGTAVPSAQRYESLLDTLQFDERSRPVYDYIVAVRNAAYAQQGQAAGAEAAEVLEEPTALIEVAGTEAVSVQPQAWTSDSSPAAAASMPPAEITSIGRPPCRPPRSRASRPSFSRRSRGHDSRASCHPRYRRDS
jgi:hypothetical protein